MKKNTLVWAFILVIGLAFTSCNEKKQDTKEEAKEQVKKELIEIDEVKTVATDELAMAVYACPMKCEGDKTYHEAGKCPKCKMNLKEVEKTTEANEEQHEEDGDDHDH